MKTWEMIKKLTEYPNKEFKLKNEDNIVYASDLHSEGKIELDQVDFITIYDEWEEVKEPVSFMEAVKSGKEISVEYSGASYKELSLANMLYELQQDFSDKVIRQIILNGKFYIED